MQTKQALNKLYSYSRLEVAQSKAIHDSLLKLCSDETVVLSQEEYEGALISLGQIKAIATENEFQLIKTTLKSKLAKTEKTKTLKTITK